MRKICILILILCSISVHSQDCKLSTEGQKHWLKASMFIEDATNDNDYQLAITELEKILVTDVNCPDVYYNLGVLHSKLILKKGRKKAEKSKQYLKEYLRIVPSDSETVEKEYLKIEARLEKYNQDIANGIIIDPYHQLKDFEGLWQVDYPVILDSTGAVKAGYTSGLLTGDWRTYPEKALNNIKIDMINFYNEYIGELANLRFKIVREAENEFRIYSNFGLDERSLTAEKMDNGFYTARVEIHPTEEYDVAGGNIHFSHLINFLQIFLYYKDVNQMYCSFNIFGIHNSADHVELKLKKCE